MRIDIRLLDISMELDALELHLKYAEEQITHIERTEKDRYETLAKIQRSEMDDFEWQELRDEYTRRVEYLVPSFFRVPYLVVLYAVYESAIIEIACLLQEKQSQQLSIDDLRGDLLARANKYFTHVLKFQLCPDSKAWNKIILLSDLRHAIAHANGRIEMLNQTSRKKITNLAKKNMGIDIWNGHIMITKSLVEELLSNVRTSLDDLVNRYKEWDDKQS